MKRSEMIKELAKYLKRNDQHVGFTKELALIVAKKALDCVEKRGMLPPETEVWASTLDGGYTTLSVNDWED